MLDTLTMEFPEIKDEETKSADEEHDDKEAVSHSSHDVKCKGKEDGHVINFKLVNFFKPSLDYGIIL